MTDLERLIAELIQLLNSGSVSIDLNITHDITIDELSQKVKEEIREDHSELFGLDVESLLQRIEVLESGATTPEPDPLPSVTPPITEIILPAPNSVFVVGDDVELEANAEAFEGAEIQTVEFFLGDIDDNSEPFHVERQYRYQAKIQNVQVGEYKITVRATDTNGLSTLSEPIIFTVLAQQIDPVEPDPVDPPTDPVDPGPNLLIVHPNQLGVFDLDFSELLTSNNINWGELSDERANLGRAFVYEGGNHYETPGIDEFAFYLELAEAGDYRVRLHSLISRGSSQTDSNDVWFKIDGATTYGIKGSSINYNLGPNVDGYVKIYQNELGEFTWDTFVMDNDPHDLWVNFPAAGSYKVRFSGRSEGFAIDKLVIHKPSVSDENALTLELIGGGPDPDPVDPVEPPVDPVDPPTDPEPPTVPPVGADPASGSILIEDVLANGETWFHIKADEYDLGPITEQEFKTNEPQWEDVKSHSGDEMQKEFGVFPVMHREENNPDFIRLVDPKGGSDPWWKKFLAKSSDAIGASMQGDTAVIEFEIFFPKHNFSNDGTFNGWLPDKHGKFMSGIQLDSGVGKTGQNPQPDGVAEVAFGWYGPDSTALINNKNAKGDWYDTKWPEGGMDQGPDSTYLGWGLYVHDPRANFGHKYQQHIYGLSDLDNKTRMPFRWDVLYKSRALFRLNTPGYSDGVLYWEVSEDGGPYKAIRFETDIDYRGNSSDQWADSGFAFFPGGGDGSFLLEGLSRSFYFNNVRVTVA